MTEPTLAVIGAPISAGAHHGGLEQTPARLREIGLVQALKATGLNVVDCGDVTPRVFTQDQRSPTARNAALVADGVLEVAAAVSKAIAAGTLPVVLGGDCTVTLGVVTGVKNSHDDVGLLYFDGNADLVTPETTRSGILDAMVVAHLLGDAVSPASGTTDSSALLNASQIALLGYDEADVDSFDAALLARHDDMFHRSDRQLAADPAGTARAARRAVSQTGRAVVVHFDVDAVDSADLPLADFPHYGAGLSLDQAVEVLTDLISTEGLAAIVLTEVNTTYDPSNRQVSRYIEAMVTAICKGLSLKVEVP